MKAAHAADESNQVCVVVMKIHGIFVSHNMYSC